MTTTVHEIPLENICPSPANPRKRLDPAKLDELAASIKQKGVIEPIIVRPAKVGYEIVAGERRHRAAGKAGLATIPAIIRELSDDEAYDFMLVENLQRDDLTDREEAESFKAYVERHGEEGVMTLAEKTGIRPGYIRSRVDVLTLPAKVLKAWEDGKLCFGHLHQLLRIHDDAARQEMIKTVLQRMSWREGMTVEELRQEVEDEAPALSAALFKAKETCASCPSNSSVQKELFDVQAKNVRCLNPKCFMKRQAEWLTMNWKTTLISKNCGTNGFRFESRGCREEVSRFYTWGGQPGKKCQECPNFVSIIEISGKLEHDKACAGEKSCFNAVTKPRSAQERETGERDSEAPRAAWHGEYFRDVFLSKRIPGELAKLAPTSWKAVALLLTCAIHGHRSEISVQEDYSGGILRKPEKDIEKAILKTIEKIVLSGEHIGPSWYNGFGTKGRRIVAEYLGIDLAKEYAVDQDYLEKKTKAEILAFGKKFKLLKPDEAGKLKKPELIKLILAHGDKLIGKVPVEILK